MWWSFIQPASSLGPQCPSHQFPALHSSRPISATLLPECALTPATAFSSLAHMHPPGSVFCRDLSCLDLSCLAFSSWKHALELATTSPSMLPSQFPWRGPTRPPRFLSLALFSSASSGFFHFLVPNKMIDSTSVMMVNRLEYLFFHEAIKLYMQCSGVSFLALVKYTHLPYNSFIAKEIFSRELGSMSPKIQKSLNKGSRRHGFIRPSI